MKKVKVKYSAVKELIHDAIWGVTSWGESWTGPESVIVKNPPAPYEEEEAIVQPVTDTQVADSELPIGDPKWTPKTRVELGMAMKQICEHIPESQMKTVWDRVKAVVDKSREEIGKPLFSKKLVDLSVDKHE